MEYISADEAWEEFSQYYFSSLDDEEMYKEGFSNDNPLAQSSSYTVYVDNIENQDRIVQEIEAMDGVRTVNQLQGATTTLSTFNRLVSYISIAIILILLCVAVFLISNTVAIGISIR